jgi:adenylosuccinate lyase
VQAGGDRQAVHEVIRRHSIAAARAMKDEGKANDLLERLAADTAFPVPGADVRAAVDPARFVGRAPAQVDEFLGEVIGPILVAAGEAAPPREPVRV